MKDHHTLKGIPLTSISKKDLRKKITGKALVKSVHKEGKFTVLQLEDGSGEIKGVLSHDSDIGPEQMIRYEGIISSHSDTMQVSIKRFDFVVGHDYPDQSKEPWVLALHHMEEFRESIGNATAIITSTFKKGRQIIIRHHADCDGYVAAQILYDAILFAAEKEDVDISRFKPKRLPMTAPLYSYEDASRDLNYALTDVNKFGNPAPLIILLDNGGTKDDRQGRELLAMHGFRTLVIDHHPPGEESIGEHDVVSPYACGADPEGMCAAHLSAMIAIKVGGYINHELLAAATMADKAHEHEPGKSVVDQVSDDEEYLWDLAYCIDYQAYTMRSSDATELMSSLLGRNKELRQKWVNQVAPEIKEKREKLADAVARLAKVEEVKGLQVVCCAPGDVIPRGYPTVGKVVGVVFRNYEEKGPTVLFGFTQNSVTIRITTSLQERITLSKIHHHLQESFPEHLIEGGGHEVAGTLHFSQDIRDQVQEKLLELVRSS